MKPFEEQNYYEVLEISPDAVPLEIRRAYKKSFALYQDDSIASYSFFSEEERQGILARIEQAYLTLINPEARTAYDQSLIASGLLDGSKPFGIEQGNRSRSMIFRRPAWKVRGLPDGPPD